jgi:hypothetical protein
VGRGAVVVNAVALVQDFCVLADLDFQTAAQDDVKLLAGVVRRLIGLFCCSSE